MLTRIRWFVIVPFVVLMVVVGVYYARSLVDKTPPHVDLKGIEEGGYYANEVPCIVAGSDNYKVSSISIWLDEKPLVADHVISRKRFEYPFALETKDLSQGKHKLKISALDGSKKKNEFVKEYNFFVDNEPCQAGFAKIDGDFNVLQGRTLHVQFQVNKEIKEAYAEVLSHKYPCVRKGVHSLIYECFIPIPCEENPGEQLFRIFITDNVKNHVALENKFLIVAYPFKKQLLSVSSDKVKEEQELGKPEAELERVLEEITRNSPICKRWHGEFYMPVESRGVSTDFGVLRTTQERGKYRHNAVDLLGMPRSVVWAPQDGVIVLKDRFVHSGNTIVIDHGCGILSLLFHLENFADVEVGESIKRGKPVGTLGKTGYASGYHLHWEMRIQNIQVDPMQWTKSDF